VFVEHLGRFMEKSRAPRGLVRLSHTLALFSSTVIARQFIRLPASRSPDVEHKDFAALALTAMATIHRPGHPARCSPVLSNKPVLHHVPFQLRTAHMLL